MTRVSSLLFVLLLMAGALTLTVHPVYAESEEDRAQAESDARYEEHKKEQEAKKEQAREMARSLNPYYDELEEKAKEMSDTLSPSEVENLVTVREAFGMVRSIRLVQGSVSRTVKLCGEENPDIRDEMAERYDEWADEVGAAMNAQEEEIDSYISKDHFDDPELVRSYLDLVDKAAVHAEEQIETTPVTDLKSCQGLLKSMDDTQPKLVKLLGEIEWGDDAPVIDADDEEGKK